MDNKKKKLDEWKDLRYGMFIHWGLYALLGRGEWVMFNEAVDKDEYRKLMERFSAERFCALDWAKAAKRAGMKYMVLVTRHHDGFALWDSPASAEAFTSMHAAAGRDIVREFTDACRSEGLKVGLYYSPMDWRFPGYFLPRMYRKSAMAMRQQCHEQIRELLTNYGKIDIFFFDGGEDFWLCHGMDLHSHDANRDMREDIQCPDFWGAGELDEMIRTLQPGIVINNRYGNRELGDYLTPEGYIGEYNTKQEWESNMTLNNSWGWTPSLPRSRREILGLIVKAATGDGNLLLNVGPRGDGSMEEEQVERLAEVGDWLAQYGDSIYKTRGGPFRNTGYGGMTYRENVLYIHVWDWKRNIFETAPLCADILRVQDLTGDTLQYAVTEDGRLRFSVGAPERDAADTVIRVELNVPVHTLASDRLWCREPEADKATQALIVEKL